MNENKEKLFDKLLVVHSQTSDSCSTRGKTTTYLHELPQLMHIRLFGAIGIDVVTAVGAGDVLTWSLLYQRTVCAAMKWINVFWMYLLKVLMLVMLESTV